MKPLEKRIHHELRKKQKVKKLINNVWKIGDISHINLKQFENRLVKNTTLCSCPACGNPRKHFKERTIQEKKNIIKFEDSLKEI